MRNEHDGQHQPDNGLIEKLRKLLRRYFETDVNFVDDVHFLVGRI